MAPLRKKEKQIRKTMLCFYFCLMKGEFIHMLRWINKEERIFSILFKHMKSRSWDPKYLAFFKALDNLSPRKSEKYAKEDSEGCKRRCKANLQKLCSDGVFEFIKQKSIDKCTKIKYYRFVEMPHFDCIRDLGFSLALRENIEERCSSQVNPHKTIEPATYEVPESVYKINKPAAYENVPVVNGKEIDNFLCQNSMHANFNMSLKVSEEPAVIVTEDRNDKRVYENQIVKKEPSIVIKKGKTDMLAFDNQMDADEEMAFQANEAPSLAQLPSISIDATEKYEEIFTNMYLSRREATTNRNSENASSEMHYNRKDKYSSFNTIKLSCCTDMEDVETFYGNVYSSDSINNFSLPDNLLESENSMDINNLLFDAATCYMK